MIIYQLISKWISINLMYFQWSQCEAVVISHIRFSPVSVLYNWLNGWTKLMVWIKRNGLNRVTPRELLGILSFFFLLLRVTSDEKLNSLGRVKKCSFHQDSQRAFLCRKDLNETTKSKETQIIHSTKMSTNYHVLSIATVD